MMWHRVLESLCGDEAEAKAYLMAAADEETDEAVASSMRLFAASDRWPLQFHQVGPGEWRWFNPGLALWGNPCHSRNTVPLWLFDRLTWSGGRMNGWVCYKSCHQAIVAFIHHAA